MMSKSTIPVLKHTTVIDDVYILCTLQQHASPFFLKVRQMWHAEQRYYDRKHFFIVHLVKTKYLSDILLS